MKEISKREFSKSIAAAAAAGATVGSTLAIADPESKIVVAFSGAKIASAEIPLEPTGTFAERLLDTKIDLELASGVSYKRIIELSHDAYRFMRKTSMISMMRVGFGESDKTTIHWRGFAVSVKNSALELVAPYDIPDHYYW